MENFKRRWHETTWIAIDLETTGQYPLDAEICEMAAVKWRDGEVVDTYQTLIRPTQRMSDKVISIHNITNEMVETAPRLEEKLGEFHRFLGDGHILAHHAPFDMGFLSWEFEQARLALPVLPGFCTSLISRAVNADVKNHRLATLAEHFGIAAGSAHRALDDARTCLNVALRYFEKLGPEAKLSDIQTLQATALPWDRFSIDALLERDHFRTLVRALKDRREVMMVYDGGSRPGEPRRVFPVGLVRQPEFDFLVAVPESHSDADEIKPKRYYLNRISKVELAGY